MSDTLIDLNGRVRDRAREQTQRRARLIGRLLAVLAIVALLGWAATASPIFSARKVVVTGNKVVTTEAVLAGAAVPLNVPLLQVDTAAVGKRVSAIPGIGRGDVSWELPDTITIRVVERSVAFVVAVDGGFAWVDPAGQRFNQSATAPDGIPLAAVNGDDPQLLSDVATVVSAMPSRLKARVKLVSAQTRDSVTIEMTDGLTIVWGSADSSSLKGQVADAFTQAAPKTKVIDVSSPTNPTVR